jgi:hypothetical protein
MTDDDDSTDRLTPRPQVALRRHRGDLTLEDRLDAIEVTQQQILEKMSEGSTSFSTLRLRLLAVETIVYSACAIGLAGLVGSLLFLVLKGGPVGHA